MVGLYDFSMVMRDKASRYYGTKPKELAQKELKESEEEAIRSLKFSQLMREPVTRQLNVVVNKGEREFTGMLLGKGESDDNRIWDIKI